jgi:hypothetical protein
MSPRSIIRTTVDTSLKAARLPVDTANRVLGRSPLAIDAVDATVRETAGRLLGDDELRADGVRRRVATEKRVEAERLRGAAKTVEQHADAEAEERKQQAVAKREEADETAKQRKQQAAKQAQERKQQAAARERQRKAEGAEAAAERTEREKALVAEDEASRLKAAAGNAKAARKA